MKHWERSYVFLHLLMFLHPKRASKVWQPSTSLEDPINWGLTGLPKECDRLVLVQAVDETVEMPTSKELKVTSVSLAREGVLTFPQMSVLKLTSPSTCAGKPQKDVKFESGYVRSWLDPQNWRDTNVRGGWLPHRNRIPCTGEDILFPEHRALTVTLPTVLLPFGTITVKGKIMGALEWSSYLQSEEGYESFKGPADVRTMLWRTRGNCSNEQPCFCTREAYTIRDWDYKKMEPKIVDEVVCMYAKPRCEMAEVPQCYSPVYPEGHCCGVCGFVLNVHSRGNAVDLEQRIVHIVSQVIGSSASSLFNYVGFKSNGDIQIVILAPNGDVSEIIDKAHALFSELKKDALGYFLDVSFSYSGWSTHKRGAASAVSLAFGTLLALFSCFASIYYLYVVLPKHKWECFAKQGQFTFARFQSTTTSVSHERLVLKTELQSSDSFANPLFNQDTVPDGAIARLRISNPSASKEELMPMQETPLIHFKGNQLLHPAEPPKKENVSKSDPPRRKHKTSDSESDSDDSFTLDDSC